MTEWYQLIQRWLAFLRGSAARPATVSLRRSQMSRFAADHVLAPPFSLSASDLAEWLGSHEWSKETIRSHRACLRSFYGWAHVTGITDQDPARQLPKVPAQTPAPRPAREDVVQAALAGASDRVRLMLLLGRRLGLRRGEIAQVHSRDLTTDGAGGAALRVQGKGGKVRTVPLGTEIARLLHHQVAGYVFPGQRGGFMTPAHVGKLMARAMAGDATAHQLRHRFATAAYAASGDIVAVSRLLGHASVATTQRYVATDDQRLRAAMDGAA